ncbi:hypothetical protein [Streptomyces sp. NPDC014006]|uniref:hypothetical protein n=1 Tax=Streptomyces sp. NPDC014006 TaxID=3364870 RepID=UPI0036FDEABE
MAAVLFPVLMGSAPVFMTTQNEMLHSAPGRTDLALAANSGSYNAGIAADAALRGVVLPLADVRGTFLAGGLMTVGACAVLLAGRLVAEVPLTSRVPVEASAWGRLSHLGVWEVAVRVTVRARTAPSARLVDHVREVLHGEFFGVAVAFDHS